MREMELIEHQLLGLDSSVAMDLMVLEAKIRERFQNLEHRVNEKYRRDDDMDFAEDLSVDELQSLIPKELPPFPTLDDFEAHRKRKRTLETVGMAAVLAVVTALGVFGLASILQLALTWLA